MEHANHIVNKRIRNSKRLAPPIAFTTALPLEGRARDTVEEGRRTIENILDGKDKRKIIIVGPCSIHDTKAGLEYAEKLYKLSQEGGIKENLYLVMRTYFEKPRTTIGWKGLIRDPELNESFKIEKGLWKARKFLLDVANLGIPAATEFLDPIIPQYISDLISWGAIGARTTESQIHREMASGLSMPVGFKNSTEGGYEVAINAMESSGHEQHFIGHDEYGATAQQDTTGNEYTHVILRGGKDGPNCDSGRVREVQEMLGKRGLPDNIMIDCSHDNSGKDFRKQSGIFYNAFDQIRNGNKGIIGMMLESNLHEGRQTLDPKHPENLKYGLSVTDSCIGWEETESLIRDASYKLKI